MRGWRDARLRDRIFVTFSLLIAAMLIATLLSMRFSIDAQVRSTLQSQLLVTGQVFRREAASRLHELRFGATQLANDFGLKRVLATFDPASLASVAINSPDRMDADLCWIADEQGELLADSEGRHQPGTSMAGVPVLAESLGAGEVAAAVDAVDGSLFALVAVPVRAPAPIGFLLIGRRIDDEAARRLRGDTGSEVSFLGAGTVLASSWGADARRELARLPLVSGAAAAPPARAAEATVLTEMRGRKYLSLVLRIDGGQHEPVLALIQRSYDAAWRPWRDLQLRLVAIALVGLAVTTVVVGRLAAGITAPVARLVRVMRRVRGGDLEQTIEVERHDEIGFLGATFDEMLAGLRERERIRDAFGRFVSRDVAAHYLSGRIPLDGERRAVTVLFQDIRGFTNLSETMPPERVRRILNRVFTGLVAAVEAEGGTVNQFLGDGMLAIFGAPVQCDDHPVRAARAALGMVARLDAVNRQFEAAGLPRLEIGVGVHTGEVVVGPFGPDERLTYTVVGDTVNLASRIEGLTRDLGTTILVSDATAAHLGWEFRLGRRAVRSVKGRSRPVEVVELLAEG